MRLLHNALLLDGQFFVPARRVAACSLEAMCDGRRFPSNKRFPCLRARAAARAGLLAGDQNDDFRHNAITFSISKPGKI
jgi:hypothetical protein